MNKFVSIALTLVVFLLIDWYVFQAVRIAFQTVGARRWVYGLYWAITALTLLAFLTYQLAPADRVPAQVRTFLMVGIFVNYLSKTFAVLFVFVDDLGRLGRWVASLFRTPEPSTAAASPGGGTPISRSEFLMKTAVVMGTLPLAATTFGIVSGAHDYRVRRVRVRLPNLPRAFDGLRIAQLSDIHSGSFFNQTAVRGGVQMLLREKPDVVFFTGDLVNNRADEMKDYKAIFEKVRAPLGVYSVLGNHDYGDYVRWPSEAAKRQNLDDLVRTHREMGWDILLDEHRLLTVDGQSIAVLGIQNWGAKGRFPKYGDVAKARQGAEDQPVKLLLSHDPSHWRAQVLPDFPDIDVMFAGHTHGMQFGVEIGGLKWSPVQYFYQEWAGLYDEGDRHLYVNRGYGYLGFPGRIGILPEITIMELTRG